MEKTKRMIVALVAVVSLIGIAPAPAQAVPSSCSSDFTIQEGRPTLASTLAADGSVTGAITIGTSDSKEVFVELDSLASELHFGAFMDDSGTCKPAEDLTTIDCADHEEIVTDANNLPPRNQPCLLETPTSGTFTYYFHVVNPTDFSLEYRVWEEDQ